MNTFENTKVVSTGWVTKSEAGFSFQMTLHILPTDDLLTADGPVFKTAEEAATALLKVYGQESDKMIGEGLS